MSSAGAPTMLARSPSLRERTFSAPPSAAACALEAVSVLDVLEIDERFLRDTPTPTASATVIVATTNMRACPFSLLLIVLFMAVNSVLPKKYLLMTLRQE